jgi:hypothetical protein
MTSRVEVKVTIAKLVELAYSKDNGMTAKIVRKKGNFKLTVDKDGNATLSGSAGVLTFKGDSALSSLGAKIKNVSIMFSHGQGNNVNYTAMCSFSGAANITLTGSFDIEELILSCSGLLCRAARALKGRNAAYEMELKKIMGY